ncbi:thermonuclease family protein [SAR86 cluster bacterium]|nr:thermonuclease family protein [SAR86 cluster bacterium]
MKSLICFFLLVLPFFVNGEYLEDLKIKKIVDGDTVHVFYQDEVYKIRLTEIDAPERDQPYGSNSTEYLKGLLKEGRVDVDISGTDRYGRKLGRLYWQGMDINRKLVSAGYAWVYDQYVTDNSFYENQSKARNLKKGLWEDQNPLEPWNWRKLKN